MSATEAVRLLNDVFSAFDVLGERLGMEKIKTVGDAYMVAGGVPVPMPDHVEAIAEPTPTAVATFNRLAASGKRVGGLFHSTC